MPTIESLRADLMAEQSRAQRDYSTADDHIRTILTRVKQSGRTHLTSDEDRRVDAAAQRRLAATQLGDELGRKLADLNATVVSEARYDHANRAAGIPDPDMLARRGRSDRPAYDHVYRVGREERTYRPGPGGTPATQSGDNRFLSDVIGAYRGDYSAQERLARHQREETVERGGKLTRAAGDAGTGQFAGLVVPQYLTEFYAPKARAMRPFANNCTPHDLPPDGMTVNISQITTGSSVDLQAAEFDPIAGVSMDDTLLTENVQTAAGFQDLSRQAIDRGTGIEDVTMNDLFRAHATRIDFTLLNQATTGLAAVSANQTYTDADVTTAAIPKVWKQIIQAQNSAEAVLLGQAPVTHVVMNPRRWNWITAAVSASYPVIAGTNSPPQSWGVQLSNGENPDGIRGVTASGLKIIADANVTTAGLAQATTGGTQDHIYVVAADECHLWEDPDAPTFIRAEQPRAKNMAVTLVVYSYFAYCFRRYASASVTISGTGLATPSFV